MTFIRLKQSERFDNKSTEVIDTEKPSGDVDKYMWTHEIFGAKITNRL